jgi:hypothetical protein
VFLGALRLRRGFFTTVGSRTRGGTLGTNKWEETGVKPPDCRARSSFPRENDSDLRIPRFDWDCLPSGIRTNPESNKWARVGGWTGRTARVLIHLRSRNPWAPSASLRACLRLRRAIRVADDVAPLRMTGVWESERGRRSNRHTGSPSLAAISLFSSATFRIPLWPVSGRGGRNRRLSRRRRNPGRQTWRRWCCPAGPGRDLAPGGRDCS